MYQKKKKTQKTFEEKKVAQNKMVYFSLIYKNPSGWSMVIIALYTVKD